MFSLLALVLISLISFYNFYWKRRNFPPGPTPWPIIGNTLEIYMKEPGYDAYIDWSNKYGPIYTFWLGEIPVICLTDFNMINETFVKDGDAYTGRMKTRTYLDLVKRTYGIIWTEDHLWKEQRRFALQVLRNFGLGKNIMQERILVELSSMIEKVKIDIDAGVTEHDLHTPIGIGIGSLINVIMFGYRFEGETLKEFHELKPLLGQYIAGFGNPWTLFIQKWYQFAEYVPFCRHYYHLMKNAAEKLHVFLTRQIDEHSTNFDPESEPTDYVEAFLREMAKREDEGNIAHHFSIPQLLGMCFDIWLAGQDTTHNTISWGILYLMIEPEIQAKMQQELDQFIGSDRLITLEDKKNLQYTQAVICEIQRFGNLLPMNVRRSTTRDVTIQGWHIPEGTEVLPQISVLLYDDKIFPNPRKFDPSRFLDANGKCKSVDELVPFGIGKRICLGEGIARMELFLFLTNIFNQFKISVAPGKYPNLYKKAGASVAPLPYVCQIEKRY